MRAYDLICKKRDGKELTEEEIRFFIDGCCSGQIPDEQTAAFLMAVYFRSMSRHEIFAMTKAMIDSGERADLSRIKGIKVDKHSTGGVGDKTTLVIIPAACACGVVCPKLSGRGLGHTGGTVDKLEAIPGYRCDLSKEEFAAAVNRVGAGISGQSASLAPADKKIYALRDITGTVEVPALIAASIMSKKLASGADRLLLDITVGSGAFNKDEAAGLALGKIMLDIAQRAGKKTVALLTDMDEPLGFAIGNTAELIEAFETLKGRGPADLTEICIAMAGEMLYLAGKGNIADCRAAAKQAITGGAGLKKLKEIIASQGGDPLVCDDYSRLPSGEDAGVFKAEKDGFITGVDCSGYGRAAQILGAGRARQNDGIDYGAGILLLKKRGDTVKKGDIIARLFSNSHGGSEAVSILRESTFIGSQAPPARRLILGRIENEPAPRLKYGDF